MKFFIASRWKNKNQVIELTEKLRKAGHGVFSFIENGANLLTGLSISSQKEYFKKSAADWKANQYVRAIFDSELEGLKNGEALILLLPCGRSAHIQAGIAYGLDKRLILIGKIAKPEVQYLIFDSHYETIDEFLKSLTSKDF